MTEEEKRRCKIYDRIEQSVIAAREAMFAGRSEEQAIENQNIFELAADIKK